jgi:hypothetical protein
LRCPDFRKVMARVTVRFLPSFDNTAPFMPLPSRRPVGIRRPGSPSPRF